MFGNILNDVKEAGTGLKDKWVNWAAQPQNKAMLVQMGLGMMQPVSPGQSPIGHFGQAIGQGFEARGRAERQTQLDADKNYTRTQQEEDRAVERSDRVAKNKLGERQVAVQERNADSLASQRARGVSYNSLFSNNSRDQDRFENYAVAAAKAAAENDFMTGDPDNPKSQEDFMADQAWMQQQRQIWTSIPQVGAPSGNALPAPSIAPQGGPQASVPPQPTAQPIPQPTGATPKYTDGQVVTTAAGRYKAVIVNGKKTWQKL